jgi:D-3-phosphoglycerate dehydrogenase
VRVRAAGAEDSPVRAEVERPAVPAGDAVAGTLDRDAMPRALEAGSLGGALLDVYPEEPLAKDGPLFRAISDRLLLTPHAAGVSWDIPGLTARIVAEGVASLLKGDTPRHVVNPDALATCLGRLQALRGG